MASKTLPDRVTILSPAGLEPLLTNAQLQAYYGVSNWTVNQWVQKGCPLEPTPFHGRRFDLGRVKSWIEQEAAREAA